MLQPAEQKLVLMAPSVRTDQVGVDAAPERKVNSRLPGTAFSEENWPTVSADLLHRVTKWFVFHLAQLDLLVCSSLWFLWFSPLSAGLEPIALNRNISGCFRGKCLAVVINRLLCVLETLLTAGLETSPLWPDSPPLCRGRMWGYRSAAVDPLLLNLPGDGGSS